MTGGGMRGMPWSTARSVGDSGEDLACRHLEALGWEVVERNWRCREGELDVVARDAGVLVFCEVKTRRSLRFGAPVEAVTADKARRLRRLAWAWLAEHGQRGREFRIDVVGVHWPTGREPAVQHLLGVA